MKVGEFIVGPKHKPAERTAIYDPKNNDLLTEEKKILATTLETVMNDTTRGDPLTGNTI